MAHAIITICSGCGRRKVDGGWQDAADNAKTQRITHGMCEECVRRLYPEDAEWIIRRAAAQIAGKRAQNKGV